MTPRRERTVALSLFALLLLGGYRPLFLKVLLAPHPSPQLAPQNGLDRRPLRLWSDPTPSELRQFLDLAAAQTRAGERVALLLPPPYDGFSYQYWQGSYRLAGRTVLLPPPQGDPAEADVVLCWHTTCEGAAMRVAGGAIVRRKR